MGFLSTYHRQLLTKTISDTVYRFLLILPFPVLSPTSPGLKNNNGYVFGEKIVRKTLTKPHILPFSRFSEQHIAIFLLATLLPPDGLFCQSVWVTVGQFPLQVGESAMFTLSISFIGVIFGGRKSPIAYTYPAIIRTSSFIQTHIHCHIQVFLHSPGFNIKIHSIQQ